MGIYVTDTWATGGDGHYTHQEDMYMRFLNELLPNFKGGSVLEIGPGTGEFAKRLIKNFDITEYRVLDLEQNIQDSINNVHDAKLGIEVTPVLSSCYSDTFDTPFDLVVSNVCIPETPKNYRESLLNNVIPNTKHAMIIGQLTGSWVEGSEYEDWIRELFDNNFTTTNCELTPYKNCYTMTGSE